MKSHDRLVRMSLPIIACVALWACETQKRPAGSDIGVGPDALVQWDVYKDTTDEVQEDALGKPQHFRSPQALAAIGDLVVVANTNTAFVGQKLTYGEGFLTVLDATKGFEVVGTLSTTHKNPQALAVHGSRLYVVCSGESEYDPEKGIVKPTSPGALEYMALSSDDALGDLHGSTRLLTEVPLSSDHALSGFPSSIVMTDGGEYAYLGSGTAPAIFKVDLAEGKLVRGPENPIWLGQDHSKQGIVTLEWGPQGILFAADGNSDTVYALQTPGDQPAPGPFQALDVGESSDLEMPIDMLYVPETAPDLYVLMSISGAIRGVTLAQGVVQTFATAGSAPNQLLRHENELLVVNSLDNDVTAFELGTGKSLGTVAVLPPNTNPYDALVYDNKYLLVTGYMSNSVFVFDLSTGQLVREVE